ncbi:MAG: ABC transporter permease [Rothia sp. (in: high G+C Gram-positive bacteria)]|uniref:ABC transporter permease n=1 Tax=Rothia sp. (in: high G+C Gram-positive bacteria) TaxID=1885016 RepID=UPI0026E02F6F|nr:ABC transporter permease [Rothia sp. (in: high G+C Gram-positive bacteria)]MDO5749695.1 ABC transporter permease [Rothia sp. (in: high G+C Gram-positive bacteria)]
MNNAPYTAPSPWGKTIKAALIATVMVSLIILAFVWPTKAAEYKNLPVSIAGPEVSVSSFEQGLKDKGIETFDFTVVTDRAAAEKSIKERHSYGAIIFIENGAPEVLTAPAANAAATQMLTGVATQMNAQVQQKFAETKMQALTQAAADTENPVAAGMANAMLEQYKVEQAKLAELHVNTVPVVTLAETDSNGTGLAVAAFPLVMGGTIGAAVTLIAVQGTLRRFVAVALYGVFGGLAMTLILSTWMGFIPGDFGHLWLAFGMSAAATSYFIVGVASMLGLGGGMGIGALVNMFIGNPISGASMPHEFLPAFWGELGQLMIPGASNTLLRSLAYFPEASTGAQWGVLVAWAIFGMTLGAIGWYFKERPVDVAAAEKVERESLMEKAVTAAQDIVATPKAAKATMSVSNA